jgi:hypothetical protein
VRISEEDYIEHFGVKGMHWGVRKGKKTTGVSRMRGVLIDRNARTERNIETFQSSKKGQAMAAAGKKRMGAARWQADMNREIRTLHKQTQRLQTGKLTLEDRAEMLLHIRYLSPIGMVISRRPHDNPFVNPKTGKVVNV